MKRKVGSRTPTGRANGHGHDISGVSARSWSWVNQRVMGVTPAEVTRSKVDRNSGLTAGAGQIASVASAEVESR